MYKKHLLGGIFNYTYNKNRIKELEKILQSPKVWSNLKLIKTLIQEKNKLYSINSNVNTISKEINDITTLINLHASCDINVLNSINLEIHKINKKIKKAELYKLFSQKYDNYDCYIDFKSGSGGIESQDWTRILFRMYLKWADKKNLKTKIIEESEGDFNGIKSSTIHLSGEFAFGWMRTETGIHRLVRKSPFNSNKKRHTSFTSIFVYPDILEKTNNNINFSDLRIDVYRASGAGGQHVNRTESAVRITHIPSNLVTQCQNSRSQHQNKEQALKQMKIKLYQLVLQKKNLEQKTIEKTKSNIAWGNQIRSYILDDCRIKDIRTGLETRNIQSVLDGNLDIFIEANLKKIYKE